MHELRPNKRLNAMPVPFILRAEASRARSGKCFGIKSLRSRSTVARGGSDDRQVKLAKTGGVAHDINLGDLPVFERELEHSQ